MRNDDPQSPRARLKVLLAIPERNRTEEEWNEINELEITLAPVNRRSDRPDQPVNGNAQPQRGAGGDRGNDPQRGGGGDRNQRHKPQNRKNRKPRNKPQGN